MTIFYIDPTVAVSGDGSLASPFKAWANATITQNNTYLQKAGTTANEGIFITANNVTIGAYNPATGSQIVSTKGWWFVNPPSMVLPNLFSYTSSAFVGAKLVPPINTAGVKIGSGYTGCVIRGIEVSGNENQPGITCTTAGNLVDTNCSHTVEYCWVHDSVVTSSSESSGIVMFGANNVVRYNRVTNMADDCIWIAGKNCKIYANYCGEAGLNASRDSGDSIQLTGQGASQDLGGTTVAMNMCIRTLFDEKQCIIISTAGSNSSPVWIVGNYCKRPKTDTRHNVAVFDPLINVIGNTIIGGYYGVSINSSSVNCFGNLVTDTGNHGIFLEGTVARTNVLIVNNTVSGHGNSGIYATNGDASTKIYNNVITNGYHSINRHASIIEDYNSGFGLTVSSPTNTAGPHSNFADANLAMQSDFSFLSTSSAIESGLLGVIMMPAFDSNFEPIPTISPDRGGIQLTSANFRA